MNGLLNIKLLLIIATFSIFAGAASAEDTPPKTLITNANIFDGEHEKLATGMSVLVEGNKITKIAKSISAPAGATVIDAGGKTMIPGLIDAHWHTNFSEITDAEMVGSDIAWITIKAVGGVEHSLQRGFTTVRDVGGNSFSIKKAIDQGLIPGPRIYPSGPPIGQSSGHFDFRPYTAVPSLRTPELSYIERNGVVMRADGVPEVLLRARENLRMGASQIKIATGGGVASIFDPLDVTEFTEEEVKAAVAAAENWGTYVAAHTYNDRATQMAIRAGVKSIEHGHLLTDETFKMIARKGIWLSLQPLLNDEDRFTFPDPISTAKWIEVTNGTDRAYKAAKRYKIKVAFGTDLLGDPSLPPKEGKFLAKLERWYTPYEALKMATHDNAELLAMSGPRNPYKEGALGAIKEGAYADLILVNGNPLQNLDLVADPDRNFALIMKDGKIYKNTLD